MQLLLAISMLPGWPDICCAQTECVCHVTGEECSDCDGVRPSQDAIDIYL